MAGVLPTALASAACALASSLGSEQDELEAQSVHLMLVADNGDIAAVGRLRAWDSSTAQVRYMAVAEAWQGQGAGAIILQGLEQQAVALGVKTVVLNARESAITLRKTRLSGASRSAQPVGINHQRMQKSLVLAGSRARVERLVSGFTADLAHYHST
ncbi:GNAT family N-acetyltransferase [Alishewanella longhuensis]